MRANLNLLVASIESLVEQRMQQNRILLVIKLERGSLLGFLTETVEKSTFVPAPGWSRSCGRQPHQTFAHPLIGKVTPS
jgi:hypothetical protein